METVYLVFDDENLRRVYDTFNNARAYVERLVAARNKNDCHYRTVTVYDATCAVHYKDADGTNLCVETWNVCSGKD